MSKESGYAAAKCLETGIELAMKNSIQALVTAPISKKALAMAGYKFPGQTEILAKLTNSKHFAMMLLTKNIRVGLVTTHCAISEVASKINEPGFMNANGGDKNIKVILGKRLTHTPHESLIDKSLPDISNLGIELEKEKIENKIILVCFFDYEQRPSRNSVPRSQ